MKKDERIFLSHILESITYIEAFTKNASKSDFLASVGTQDAVIRRLEIIGEAVKNLPLEFRNKYPNVPWKRISGLRDVLIHGYFGVDLELTWDIIKRDLPDLKEKIKRILKEIS